MGTTLTPQDGPRLSQQTLSVLAVMAANPHAEHYGLEVARTAHLKSGSLYPILARLEQYGWITGVWEDIDSSKEGRRPRRLYRFTPEGLREARKVTADARGLPVLQPGLAL